MNLHLQTVDAEDVERGGQAVFEFRVKQATDADPQYRQPVTYRNYKWADLPDVVRTHYRDIFLHAIAAIGFRAVL